jgi:hypothetical protein
MPTATASNTPDDRTPWSNSLPVRARRHVPTATGAGTRDTAAVSPPPAPYVTITVASSITGYSAKAIRRKIENGVWLEGREFRRAPDGHVLISLKGYQQ